MELNRDCLFTIFTFLPSQDLVTKRLTCHEWNHVCSTNSLWQSRFIEELGPVREDVASYLHEYCHWMNKFPAPSMKTCTKRVQKTMDEGLFVVRVDYDHMKLNCDPDQVNETSHQLAVILSLLNVNQHRNRLTDTLRVGNRVSGSKPILLSQFFYLLSTGQKEELLCEEDTDTSDEDDFEYTRIEHEAIGNNIEGAFVPFVNYNSMEGQVSTMSQMMERFGPNSPGPAYLENKFGSEEDIRSVYWWTSERNRRTDDGRDSWSPVFWNASFQWYNSANFVSVYNANTQMITVAHLHCIQGCY